MQYLIILDCVITALDCILDWIVLQWILFKKYATVYLIWRKKSCIFRSKGADSYCRISLFPRMQINCIQSRYPQRLMREMHIDYFWHYVLCLSLFIERVFFLMMEWVWVELWYMSCIFFTLFVVISMASCKTVVTPVLQHRSYHSLAL